MKRDIVVTGRRSLRRLLASRDRDFRFRSCAEERDGGGRVCDTFEEARFNGDKKRKHRRSWMEAIKFEKSPD